MAATTTTERAGVCTSAHSSLLYATNIYVLYYSLRFIFGGAQGDALQIIMVYENGKPFSCTITSKIISFIKIIDFRIVSTLSPYSSQCSPIVHILGYFDSTTSGQNRDKFIKFNWHFWNRYF